MMLDGKLLSGCVKIRSRREERMDFKMATASESICFVQRSSMEEEAGMPMCQVKDKVKSRSFTTWV